MLLNHLHQIFKHIVTILVLEATKQPVVDYRDIHKFYLELKKAIKKKKTLTLH